MKTSGASRKKPSQSPPGSAQATVIQPPVPACFDSPRACSGRRSSSAAACSISAMSSCGAGSGAEELGILLLPRDPDPVALAPAKSRIALTGYLREHPLAADRQVKL